ncbi:MAG: hypothetical protein Q8P57_02650 [Candidatus Pacearchaeota archaeon]|nr:hypothetical protein [Candidatus Pacearchaeota archaeon]
MDDEKNKLKMAVIAGAARATKYYSENPRASEEQIIQKVTEKVDEILENIDDTI